MNNCGKLGVGSGKILATNARIVKFQMVSSRLIFQSSRLKTENR